MGTSTTSAVETLNLSSERSVPRAIQKALQLNHVSDAHSLGAVHQPFILVEDPDLLEPATHLRRPE
jgi:hypothetical protein